MPLFNYSRPSQNAAPNPTAPSVESVIEQIAKYNEYGQAIRRTRSMRELAEHLGYIAELAEQTVMSEADDWFDAGTLKRNMSELKKFTSEFAKHAQEADLLEQRMSALYDDMGHILNRYFEISQQNGTPPVEPIAAGPGGAHPMQEGDDEVPPGPDSPTAPPPTAAPTPAPEPELGPKDELTVRAIQVVYKYLMTKNPDTAARFAALPPKAKIQCVWRLVR